MSLYKLSNYAKPDSCSGNKIKFRLELANYSTKKWRKKRQQVLINKNMLKKLLFLEISDR